MELGRRTFLGGLVAAAAAGANIHPASARSGAAAGPANTAMRNFMLMRGALDERLVVSWVSARYYAVIEDRMDPLFSVVSAVFARHRRMADGGVMAVNAELAWFTDPASGQALETYRNPLNGKVVKVPGGGFSPSRVIFGPDLSFRLEKPVPGLEMAHEVLPAEVQGGDVWLTERTRTAFTAPGAARPFRYSESNTFRASARALADPHATRVVSDVSFANVCSWRPWLEMGDQPGHLTAVGHGRHGAAMADLPPAWIAATKARRPDVWHEPEALLAPLWDRP